MTAVRLQAVRSQKKQRRTGTDGAWARKGYGRLECTPRHFAPNLLYGAAPEHSGA